MKRFNAWFDSLGEPFRFTVFVVMLMPAAWALGSGHALMACGWFVGMGVLRFSR